MFRRALQLLLAALLALALSGCSTGDNTHRIWSQAGSAAPTLPPQPQQFPNLPQTKYMRGDNVCSAVPEFAFAEYVRDKHELVIGVKSRYTTVQHAAYQAFLKSRGNDDHYSDSDIKHLRFEYSAYTCLELDQVQWAVTQVLKDVHEAEISAIYADYSRSANPRTYQTDVILPPEQSIPQARALMRSYGIPDELVGFNRTAPLLLRLPHLEALGTGKIIIPRIVEVGGSLPIQALMQINEQTELYERFAWRVIRLDTEEVMRQVESSEVPDWYDSRETFEPGVHLFPIYGSETWNLTDMDGQPVPPGKYVLQASAGVFMRPPDVMFEVVEQGGNTPMKRLQGLWYQWWY